MKFRDGVSTYWTWLSQKYYSSGKYKKYKYIAFPFSFTILFAAFIGVYGVSIYLTNSSNVGDIVFEHKRCSHGDSNFKSDFFLRHCFFRNDLVWLILIAYASLIIVLYLKKKFFDTIKNLRVNEVIYDTNDFEKIIIRKWLYITLLVPFLIFFLFFWYGPYDSSNHFPGFDFDFDLSGIFIAVLVIPLGTLIVSSFFSAAFLPYFLLGYSIRIRPKKQSPTVKRYSVNVLDPDRQGGLRPIGELLASATLVFSGGVFLAYLLFPKYFEIYNGTFIGFIFIFMDFFIFLLPQYLVHKRLEEEKSKAIRYFQSEISFCLKKLQQTYEQGSWVIHWYILYSINLNTRREIDLMKTWPFDPNILTFLLSNILIIIPILGVLVHITHLS